MAEEHNTTVRNAIDRGGTTSQQNQYLLANVVTRLESMEHETKDLKMEVKDLKNLLADRLESMTRMLGDRFKLLSLAPVTVIGVVCATFLFYYTKINEQTWALSCAFLLTPFYGESIIMAIVTKIKK